LAELKITLEGINPVEFYGSNNAKLDLIKSLFPKLKIVGRGHTLKVIGEDEILDVFEKKIDLIVEYFQKYNSISAEKIERLILGDSDTILAAEENVIVYGNHGRIIKARTVNQHRLVEAASKSDMVFAIGPAGTGKTYTAVALAVKALKEKQVRKIIMTRPAVEAGENLGFLPGDMKEKLDPYMQPLYDALSDMIPSEKLKLLIEERIIEIAPLAFMRGRTLDNAFVILDEAQNTTEEQMKMFLTRMGKLAKFIVTGDISQIDLPPKKRSGLKQALRILEDIDGIETIYLDEKDVIRHKLVKKIISAYKNNNNQESKEQTN
jgi:phosphate starvation-inducible PhoH-like protein